MMAGDVGGDVAGFVAGDRLVLCWWGAGRGMLPGDVGGDVGGVCWRGM